MIFFIPNHALNIFLSRTYINFIIILINYMSLINTFNEISIFKCCRTEVQRSEHRNEDNHVANERIILFFGDKPFSMKWLIRLDSTDVHTRGCHATCPATWLVHTWCLSARYTRECGRKETTYMLHLPRAQNSAAGLHAWAYLIQRNVMRIDARAAYIHIRVEGTLPSKRFFIPCGIKSELALSSSNIGLKFVILFSRILNIRYKISKTMKYAVRVISRATYSKNVSLLIHYFLGEIYLWFCQSSIWLLSTTITVWESVIDFALMNISVQGSTEICIASAPV